jgi:hypothetical protein
MHQVHFRSSCVRISPAAATAVRFFLPQPLARIACRRRLVPVTCRRHLALYASPALRSHVYVSACVPYLACRLHTTQEAALCRQG